MSPVLARIEFGNHIGKFLFLTSTGILVNSLKFELLTSNMRFVGGNMTVEIASKRDRVVVQFFSPQVNNWLKFQKGLHCCSGQRED